MADKLRLPDPSLLTPSPRSAMEQMDAPPSLLSAGPMEQPNVQNPEGPKEKFKQWYLQHPNIKTTDMPRWWLEQQAAQHLEAYPTWRELSQDPAFPQSALYQYKVSELVDYALTPSGMEKAQETLETYGPPALATGGGAVAGPAGAGMGAFVGSLAPQLRPLTTGAPAPPLLDTLQDASVVGATGVLGDRLIQKGVDLTARGLKNTVVPYATQAGRQVGLTALESVGGVPGLTQRGGGPVAQFAEAVGEGSLFGRGFAERRQRGVETAVDTLTLKTLGALRPLVRGDDDTALAWASEAKNLEAVYREVARQKYQVVDRLTAAQAPVAMNVATNRLGSGPVKDALLSQFVVPEVKNLQTGMMLQPGYEGADGFYAMMNQLGLGTRNADFSTAQRARSALLDINRNYKYETDNVKRLAGKVAGQMAKDIDDAMTNAATQYEQNEIAANIRKGMTPEQARASVETFDDNYQHAKAFFRRNVGQRFENEVYRGLAEDVADKPGKFIRFAMGADTVDQLKIIRQVAPKEWENVRGQVVANIFQKTVEGHGASVGMPIDQLIQQGLVKKVDGRKLVNEFNRLGPEYTQFLLGKNGLDSMRRLGAALDVSAEQAKGPGRMAIVLAQGSALASLGTGALYFDQLSNPYTIGSAGAIILTPTMFSMLLSRPGTLRLLEEGIVNGPKSTAGIKLTAFTTAHLLKESVDEARAKDALNRTLTAPQLPNPPGPVWRQGPPPPLPPSLVPPVSPPPVLRNVLPMGVPPR